MLDKQVDAVFLGFEQADIQMFSPEFEAVIDKALSYSPNLVLFLPKNTKIP